MVLWLTEKARASSASAGMRSPTFHLPDRIMDSMAVSTCLLYTSNKIIAPEVSGHDATLQPAIDKIMIDLDGTPNKSRLGADV